MPYKDPQQRRAYKRRWQRERRVLERETRCGPRGSLLPESVSAATPADLLALLDAQLKAVYLDPKLGTAQRATLLARLAPICLRALEDADLDERSEAIARELGRRPKR